MNFGNDPFFQEAAAAPPPMGLFPHMTAGSLQSRRHNHHQALMASPFGGMGMGMGMGLMPFGGLSPFSMMNGMMRNMDTMMRSMERGGSNANCFSSSTTTVMHYASDGTGGQPRVYQATSSTRQAPGGVKETRKAVRDSQTGLQKMAVGHHIGDRSHVIERKVNAKTGERAQNQEFVNLDESEADAFSSEWKEKTRTFNHTHLPSVGPSHRNQYADYRGLPSSTRPANPESGGRAGKRKARPVSVGEDGDDLPHTHPSQPTGHPATNRSPKLSRTKSPPYVQKPRPVHPYPHSHSSQFHTDTLPPLHSDDPTTGDVSKDARPRKKKSRKKTTFADAL